MNQTKICKHTNRYNLRYYIVSRDENPHSDNQSDCPSFDGFRAHHFKLQDYKRTQEVGKNTRLRLLT